MKNERGIHPATLFFLLTICTALLSWVGSIYGWKDVHNMLCAEGLRWKLHNVESIFLSVPLLSKWMVLSLGIGLFLHSGLWNQIKVVFTQRRIPSRKEKRALFLSILVAGGYCFLYLFMALGPWNVVRSIMDEFKNSPLADGTCYLLSLGIGIVAIVYAFAVDSYRTDKDIVRGMSYAFVRFPIFFVTIFFVSQFFSTLQYTRLIAFCGISPVLCEMLYQCCVIFSLLYSGFKDKKYLEQ